MKKYVWQKALDLESGEIIEHLEIAYHVYGTLNANRDNVVWVFHAISASSDVMNWWPDLFGVGKLYDPEKYFIICANTLGSPFGSSSPKDLSFPQFTVRDIANAFFELAAELKIAKIHTIIGGSFGGYQALEFAYGFTGTIDHMILLATSSKESAWGIAIHESQRMALKADKTFGQLGKGKDGMKAARAMAMLTYRTHKIFAESQTDQENITDNYKASSYINYHGTKFSEKFEALSLFYLTKCIDTHNLGRNRNGEESALSEIKIPSLIIGFTSDLLVPIEHQQLLAKHLPIASLKEFDSIYGHDGFLKEIEMIEESIREFYVNV